MPPSKSPRPRVPRRCFDWPVLSYALPLTSHAWNVPAAVSGAAACLFVREIADLRRFWPRVYTAFGWLAVAFIVLAFANIGRHFGLGGVVAAKRSGRNRVQMAEALAA